MPDCAARRNVARARDIFGGKSLQPISRLSHSLVRFSFAVAVAASQVAAAAALAVAGTLASPYVSPSYFLPWGTSSHWIQPWRSYMETIPASVFVDGTGIAFNVDQQQAELVATMLAKSGIHHARLEIAWGSFDYDHEDQLKDSTIAAKLAALEKHGLRPLILLNSNSGQPCPMKTFRRKVVSSSPRGTRQVVFDNVEGLVPGYSGLSDVGSDKGAARNLIVSLNGNTAMLSRPLTIDLAAGAVVSLATLKYRPFSAPGSADYGATMAGWQRYVVNVARIVRRDLGTTGTPNGGFDMEIWNELTFGSLFLSVDNYYAPSTGQNPGRLLWDPIVAATATTANSHPDLFSGVLFGDGFGNTIPWRAAETEPARITAIDKHPYRAMATYPKDEANGAHVDALGNKDDFVPSYTANFPEFWASDIRGDNVLREMAPFSSKVGGKLHGRNARSLAGVRQPVTVWITEVNTDPELDDSHITNDEALALKGKTTARYLTFYLNKGVTQLDLYAVADRNAVWQDRAMDIVTNDFMNYADQPGAAYPADDSRFLSPALSVTRHIVNKMKVGLSSDLTQTRPLHVMRLSAEQDGVIFHGDGTPSHPDLRAVDVFAFLPFQANLHRFVIPYYIITRDIMKSWPEDTFTVEVAGLSPTANYSVYDPIRDEDIPVKHLPTSLGVQLQLKTVDYPRLLIVDEATH